MAIDIHTYLEARARSDAPWRLLHKTGYDPDSDYDEQGRLLSDAFLDVPREDQPLGSIRSYELFALLCEPLYAPRYRDRGFVPFFEPIVEYGRAGGRGARPESHPRAGAPNARTRRSRGVLHRAQMGLHIRGARRTAPWLYPPNGYIRRARQCEADLLV